MIKQTETYKYASSKDYDYEKEYTIVTQDNGKVDKYIDTYVTDKETGDRRKVEHESFHDSGVYNRDYVGTNSTTHVHERKDGSKYAFNQNDGESPDYVEYEDQE